MKLYYSPGACSLAPHLVLFELGIPHESYAVNLKTKQFSGGDYLSVNPKGAVPALEIKNGELLTENAVILQYLADQKPEANFIPKAGTWERYRQLELLNYVATEMHKGFSPLWAPTTPDAYKAIVRTNLEKRFHYLSEKLTKHPYLAGDSMTVADAYLFTVLGWTRPLQIDLSPWPALQGYLEKIRVRPGTQNALKAEGLLK